MRIIAERTIRLYYEKNPLAKTALEEWVATVRKAEWHCFANVRNTYNSADYVGNQHYVFNIKGNDYRLVAVIKFIPQFVLIRFIGTHKEYDRIDCSTI